MDKPINNDIAIKGTALIIAVEFPPVDDKYTFRALLNGGNILEQQYYIINSSNKYTIDEFYSVLEEANNNYDNMFCFTVDTTNLRTGVLMVELKVRIPAHDRIPARVEVVRCSTGVAIVD